MADYISREAAEQAKCEFLNENGEYAKGWNDCNREFRKNILEIPAADVRPVVRGQDVWNTVTDHHCEFKCSICGEEIREHWGEDFNFCPYCGADMREETDA